MEKHLIVFLLTKFKAKKKWPAQKTKEQTRNVIFPSRRRFFVLVAKTKSKTTKSYWHSPFKCLKNVIYTWGIKNNDFTFNFCYTTKKLKLDQYLHPHDSWVEFRNALNLHSPAIHIGNIVRDRRWTIAGCRYCRDDPQQRYKNHFINPGKIV